MEWKNFDLLESYKKLEAMKETVNVKETYVRRECASV